MHPRLKEAILNQKIKKEIKNSLNEENLYATFVEPFTDIIKAANLASQEIVSSLMLIAGSFLTLDPKKQEERMKNFEARQSKIEAAWKPIMDKVDASLSTGDADIAAFAFAPGLWAASSLGTSAYNAAEGIGSYLDNLGIKTPMMSFLPGMSAAGSTSAAVGSAKAEKGSSLLDKLNILFLGTSAAAYGISAWKKEVKNTDLPIIVESKSDFVADFNKFMDETGLDDVFKKQQSDWIEHYKTIIESFDKIVEDKTKFAKSISDAKKYEEMQEVFSSVAEPDEEMRKLVDKIEKNAKKLEDDPEFLEKAKKEAGKPSLSDKEIEAASQNVVFGELKLEMEKNPETAKVEKLAAKLRSTLSKDLAKLLPNQKTIKIFKAAGTKESTELANLIQDAKNRYSIS